MELLQNRVDRTVMAVWPKCAVECLVLRRAAKALRCCT